MCNIKGHNIFSYMFRPVWTWKKLAKNNPIKDAKRMNTQAAAAEKEVEELNRAASNEVQGEMPVPTVPINTQGTGLNTLPRVGLNL